MESTVLPIFTDQRKQECLRRLKAAEGQIRGLQAMVDSQRRCVEVLTQLSAVQQALRQVGLIVLRNYFENCATDAIRRSDRKVYDEMMETVARTMS